MGEKISSKDQINLIFWCSPGFGIVDVWLPVIKKLKENRNIKIDFIFSEPSSIKLESKNSDLFKLANKFADRIIYKGYSGRWFSASTLYEAHSGIKYSNTDKKIAEFLQRLVKGRASNYFLLKVIGIFLLKVFKATISMKEDFSQQIVFNFKNLSSVSGVLCDITKEGKRANKVLRSELKMVHKFSILHGIMPSWVLPHFNCERATPKRTDVTVYSMSHLEDNGYQQCYGIEKSNIIHSGIPRHDCDWIDYICNNSFSDNKKIFDEFAFVIGRPSSPYLTPERKRQVLIDMHDIVCNKFNLKLIIKTHPKESINGIDGQIYGDALGRGNYGKTWMYSDKHPFILGEKSSFALSFYSGVSLDMLAINKPTIEYLNLKNLPLYDNIDSLRDDKGDAVFQFRYAKLVLGVNSKEELHKCVKSILSEYDSTILPIFSNYKDYFKPIENSSEMVANDILKRVNCI